MEEISLSETETRYFSDLFVCCDVDKTGKIPVLKATELFRSANLSNDAIRQITSIAGIPQKALHISRIEFYSCLKLIAAFQASLLLRSEIISSTSINLPLPRFSWKDSPPIISRAVSGSAGATANADSSNFTSLNSTASNVMSSSTTSTSSGSNVAIGANIVKDEINGLISGEIRKNSLGTNSHEPARQQQWREVRSPDLIEMARAAAAVAQETANSDLQSTDSEVEHNESSSGRVNRRHRGVGSPEAWSTNSDSPTPTNSVAERHWAKDTLWQGLLGDEHRQLLGTEEESSDRHSSDEDNETDIETIYQITGEQREYYHKQFKAVQPDPKGLLSGHIARVFFEKSRIPVEELRHIWQLCDVTRDGALSLEEFTAAMHLVVLRRNNISLPSVLPNCLHPTMLPKAEKNSNVSTNHHPVEPPEADLLHLDDDDNNDNDDDAEHDNDADSTIVPDGAMSTCIPSKSIAPSDAATTKRNDKEFKRMISRPDKNSMKLSTVANSTQAGVHIISEKSTNSSPAAELLVKNRSVSNSPPAAEPTTPPTSRTKETTKDWTNQSKEWTKFTESPTSNVSSPGPKPVNFDMLRTAQAVVSDPQILHPVPLRVTPVGAEAAEDDSSRISRKAEGLVYDSGSGISRENESSPKMQQQQVHRDSLQNNDLRAIQRPQPKKLPAKNIGAIPPPPQREPSLGGGDSVEPVLPVTASGPSSIATLTANVNNLPLPTKKDPPPLPPPRPHRHARSSSLDLNKLKMSGNQSQPEMMTQASFDVQTESCNTGFADFTQFPEANNKMADHVQNVAGNDTNSTTATIPPPPRPTISTLQTNHRASAFEVYRKPNTPRNSQSPDSQLQFQPLPPPPVFPSATSGLMVVGTGASLSLVPSTNSSSSSTSINVSSGLEYDKRVNAISETLRHVSLKNEKNFGDVLRHLREQNILLLRLCNDLSDELLTVQHRKEEIRSKLESSNSGTIGSTVSGGQTATSTISAVGSSVIVANSNAGSGSSIPNNVAGTGTSGIVHSNV